MRGGGRRSYLQQEVRGFDLDKADAWNCRQFIRYRSRHKPVLGCAQIEDRYVNSAEERRHVNLQHGAEAFPDDPGRHARQSVRKLRP